MLMHVRVELFDAAIDDHGRSLDTEVPRHSGALLDVGLKCVLLGSCSEDLVSLVPLFQLPLNTLHDMV